jgi:HAE1 family hydrophobic/amphiphilic exporter-1
LLAIATALGTLITDAIILIESALGMIERGASPEDAAVEGTKKVAVRIFATIATHVVVFLPLAFMDGIVGQFMKQFGLSVVYFVLLSSVFSFTLTPMMIARILRAPGVKESGAGGRGCKINIPRHSRDNRNASKSSAGSLSWFRPIYDRQMRHPWAAVWIAAAVLALSLVPMRWVGNEFRPSVDMNEITITARAPAGSTFAKSESIAKSIEEKLRGFPEVESFAVKIGERGVQNIRVKVALVPRGKRGLSDKLVAQNMLPELAEIPDAEIQIKAGESMGGDIGASDIILNISGDGDAAREAYADQAIRLLNRIPEIQSAVRAQQAPGAELACVPNSEAMSFWGVKNSLAGSTLRTALFGHDGYKYKEAGKEYPIILEFSKPFKNQEIFSDVFVSSPKGLVSLAELGKVEQARASADIRRLDKNRITEININLGKSTIGPVQAKIEAALETIGWAPGYSASFGGMSEIQAETTGEIGRAFLLAAILTFMCLAALLNSWAHPFTIATGILTSFAGVFVLMFLVGATVNIAAMLALIMLVGLAVSTNILVLEPTLEEMARGVPPEKALWDQFVDKKRMLAMSTIAVVAGLVPQLWSIDGMKSSMGAVIIGGILASLAWTFFLTPAIFILMERARRKRK